MICGACGTKNKVDSKFCIECGGSIFESEDDYDDIMSHKSDKPVGKLNRSTGEVYDLTLSPIERMAEVRKNLGLRKISAEEFKDKNISMSNVDDWIEKGVKEVCLDRQNFLCLRKEAYNFMRLDAEGTRTKFSIDDGFIEFHLETKSPITRRDVKKGIGGRKPPDKINPIKDMVITKHPVPPKTTENPYVLNGRPFPMHEIGKGLNGSSVIGFWIFFVISIFTWMVIE